MNNSFVPFDKFERGCAPDSKTLHETMQENCNTNIRPEPEPCRKPCVPYWQQSDKKICMDVGLVGIEETDGCGHTRINRTTQRVVWENTDETRCNEPQNRIEVKQVNQCGDERWVTTSKLCCVPIWVNDPDGAAVCDGGVEQRLQKDGCGNQRLRPTGNPINWTNTGQSQCDPGDIYRVQQVNQCGETRWITVPGGCPCIPNWQPTGLERCTSNVIEAQEVDGCGGTRWTPTSTPVNWSNTGNTRCNGSFVQNEQISQCGTTRWYTTDTPCTNSPQPNELNPEWVNGLLSGAGGTNISVRLESTTGLLIWAYNQNFSQAWVTGAYNRADYEARISVDMGTGVDQVQVSGTQQDTWFNLGDVASISQALQISGPPGRRDNMYIRIDIRKVGEQIAGGKTFGPFAMRST